MKTYVSVTDNDGQTYKAVVIGSQTWMAENLNYDVDGSKCSNDNPDNCTKYGRIYDWSTAMGLDASCNSTDCSGQVNAKHQGICPNGWHIPSHDDWNVLMIAVDGSPTAGKYLKAVNGWKSYSGIVNLDSYGFSALPGGDDGPFGGNVDYVGLWWSASEDDSDSAYNRRMSFSHESVYWDSDIKNNSQSVRCVKD
jgi:uncharacterized protein (TIGR02145 family)